MTASLDSELALSSVPKDSRVTVEYYKRVSASPADTYTELTDGVVIPSRDAYTTPSSGSKLVRLMVSVTAGEETKDYSVTLTATAPTPTPTPTQG